MGAGIVLFCSILDPYWLARCMAGSWHLINACYMETRKSLMISFSLSFFFLCACVYFQRTLHFVGRYIVLQIYGYKNFILQIKTQKLKEKQ